MSMTVGNQAALSYSTYSFTNSDAYETYAVDSSEVSEEYYNISSVSNAVEAMNDAIDSSSPYSVGKVDSYVKNQLSLSQLGIYEDLSDTIDSYDVASLLNGDTDLSEMYDLANSSNQISEDYISSLLESSGYVSSAVSSYSSYLEEDSSTTSLLDVTV